MPQESDLLYSWRDTYCNVFAWRCFPLLGLELSWAPAVNLVLSSLLDNHMGVRSTRVRIIVCTAWTSSRRGLNPRPTRGSSQTPLLLMYITYVLLSPYRHVWAPGPTPHSVSTSLGIVRTLNHSLGQGSLADKPCASWFHSPSIPGLQYWATGTNNFTHFWNSWQLL